MGAKRNPSRFWSENLKGRCRRRQERNAEAGRRKMGWQVVGRIHEISVGCPSLNVLNMAGLGGGNRGWLGTRLPNEESAALS